MGEEWDGSFIELGQEAGAGRDIRLRESEDGAIFALGSANKTRHGSAKRAE
jgi:hypothetical protein